ncbi:MULTISPECIES: hypothetical protein [Bhargavaea]|uniref:hypothetical protein n=1 Tax=Bhargavaea TaxID=941338 RepID=UPI002ADE3334|nr:MULTISPECIES: hypothetical protein [Bhargavaea]
MNKAGTVESAPCDITLVSPSAENVLGVADPFLTDIHHFNSAKPFRSSNGHVALYIGICKAHYFFYIPIRMIIGEDCITDPAFRGAIRSQVLGCCKNCILQIIRISLSIAVTIDSVTALSRYSSATGQLRL